jgi:hypothetical protein
MLSDFVALCQRIRNESAYTGKTSTVRTFLSTFGGDRYLLCMYLVKSNQHDDGWTSTHFARRFLPALRGNGDLQGAYAIIRNTVCTSCATGKLLLPGIDMRRFQVQDKQLVKLFSRVFNVSVCHGTGRQCSPYMISSDER